METKGNPDGFHYAAPGKRFWGSETPIQRFQTRFFDFRGRIARSTGQFDIGTSNSSSQTRIRHLNSEIVQLNSRIFSFYPKSPLAGNEPISTYLGLNRRRLFGIIGDVCSCSGGGQ